MNSIIRCHVLFDITHTGITNRNRQNTYEITEWTHKRNTQCNFDTVLQVISIRSLPEICKLPTVSTVKLNKHSKFGTVYKTESVKCWSFDFEIQSLSVFDDAVDTLGFLYKDCHNVPMIRCGTESNQISNFLDTSNERKNIYFEVISNENK